MQYFLCIIICLGGGAGKIMYAQKAKDELENRRIFPDKEEKKITRKKRPASKIPKKSPASFKSLKEDYKKRIKRQAKEAKKEAKKVAQQRRKRRYNDPLYFGHKRKPKRRPLGKKKLCKACGIVH